MVHKKVFAVCELLLLVLTNSALGSTSELCIVAESKTGNPEAVWASQSGIHGQAEVLYSSLEGSSWTDSTVLASDAAPDAKPVLAFDPKGNRIAVWENAREIRQVVLRALPANGGDWSEEVVVSDPSEPSQHPWVAGFGEATYISYEVRESFGTLIKVAKTDPGGIFERTLIATTGSTEPLAVQIHSESDHLWVDWMDANDTMLYSEMSEGSWSAPHSVPYIEHSSPQLTRERIRFRVLGL